MINQLIVSAPVLSMHLITLCVCLNKVKEIKHYACQNRMAMHIYAPPSLFFINLHRAKGFVIDISCRGRGCSQTLAKDKDTQTTLGGGQTGEENWFIIISPLFDLLISRRCAEGAEELSLGTGHGGASELDI